MCGALGHPVWDYQPGKLIDISDTKEELLELRLCNGMVLTSERVMWPL